MMNYLSLDSFKKVGENYLSILSLYQSFDLKFIIVSLFKILILKFYNKKYILCYNIFKKYVDFNKICFLEFDF